MTTLTQAEHSEQRIDAPTPNGGDYSVAHFRDGSGSPCAKADAIQIEIVEFRADGSEVMRTYMTRK